MDARRAAVLALAALGACLGAPSHAAAVPARAEIVGGTRTAIQTAPWQVFLAIDADLACGGSVLDPTHVLTAAHCTVPAGATAARPASSFTVLAGFDDVMTWHRGAPPPAGTQVAGVASVRVHPLYAEASKTDDVAVLVLSKALDLSSPRTRAIALAPLGEGPVAGAPLAFSGYGAQSVGRLPDGKLYAASLTAITDDQCRPDVDPSASAVVQCVTGLQGPCFGDSGGALTLGAVQVGVASYVPLAGCGHGLTGFADVTAPEVRAFLDGAAQIPVAPRQSTPAVIYAGAPPVQGSPVTCVPGTWAGAPSFTYTFVNDVNGQALQSGRSTVFVPRAPHRGAMIACVVRAANAGGTATSRSGTAAAVVADTVRPRASLQSVSCRRRRCTVRFWTYDPNSRGIMRIRVTAERRVRGWCGKGERRRRCTRTRVRGFKLQRRANTTGYRATAELARGKARIRVRIVDAAGNRRSLMGHVRLR